MWNHSEADLEGLQYYLFDSNLHTCLQSENVNDIWSVIKQHISDACQLLVPRVKVPKSPSPKWFNSEISHMQKKSLTLRLQYNRTPTLHTLNNLNQTELLLQNLIISSKKDYEHHLVSSYYSNPGKLFHHLRSLTDSTSSNYPIFHNTKPVTTPQQKAKLSNDYFQLCVHNKRLYSSSRKPATIFYWSTE